MTGNGDDLLHQPLRLRIMAALAANGSEPLEFVRLKALTGATDGNLGSHLTNLEKAGYLAIEKDHVGRKPRTRASLTREGRRAFETHVAYLKDVIAAARG